MLRGIAVQAGLGFGLGHRTLRGRRHRLSHHPDPAKPYRPRGPVPEVRIAPSSMPSNAPFPPEVQRNVSNLVAIARYLSLHVLAHHFAIASDSIFRRSDPPHIEPYGVGAMRTLLCMSNRNDARAPDRQVPRQYASSRRMVSFQKTDRSITAAERAACAHLGATLRSDNRLRYCRSLETPARLARTVFISSSAGGLRTPKRSPPEDRTTKAPNGFAPSASSPRASGFVMMARSTTFASVSRLARRPFLSIMRATSGRSPLLAIAYLKAVRISARVTSLRKLKSELRER